MKRINLRQTARKILEDNQYLTLATVNPDGRAWVSPVVYAADKNNNLYYLSQTSSRHSQNIKNDERVSLAIFDSRQKWGGGVGLQIEGKAEILNLKASVSAFKTYFGRKWPFPGQDLAVKAFQKMVRGKIYRFYKVTPIRIWLNDPRVEKDVRVRVRKSPMLFI